MKINKTGYHILNAILFASIILGFYEIIDIKTLVGVFISPAFILAASLGYKSKKERAKNL